MKNNYPTYWLFVIILPLILAGNVFGQFPPAPDPADFNRDGTVNFLDFCQYLNAYGLANGGVPEPKPNTSETYWLKVELNFCHQQIASLEAQLQQRHLEDTDHVEKYIQELDTLHRQRSQQEHYKVRETMIAIGTQLLNSGVAYTINVNGQNANFKVTFDPNGVR